MMVNIGCRATNINLANVRNPRTYHTAQFYCYFDTVASTWLTCLGFSSSHKQIWGYLQVHLVCYCFSQILLTHIVQSSCYLLWCYSFYSWNSMVLYT